MELLWSISDVLAVHVATQEDDGVWADQCGQGIGHVLGWLPLLQRLKILSQRKPGTKSSRVIRGWHFGKGSLAIITYCQNYT